MEEIFLNLTSQFESIGWLEWFGTITGALCVYLAAKESLLNWPIAILSILSYIFIFYDAKLYGDTLLQFYFLATSIYGWYYWSVGKSASSLKSQRPIVKVGHKEWIVILFIQIFGSLMVGYLLDQFTDTDVPYIDAVCTLLSFIAQYLMTRKRLENWLIWILVDAIYIPLYYHKDLFATAILYFIFLFIALKGYLDWRKSYNFQLKNDQKTT